jgi:hypothetical protein
MRIINVADIEAKEVPADPLFFGGKVATQLVLEEEHKAKKIQVVTVKFAPGARNKSTPTQPNKSSSSPKAKDLFLALLHFLQIYPVGNLCRFKYS